MNQIFINCKFNLRKASSNKPMPIYLVAYISGKQYKVATGVKVLPFQWDKHRQIAIVSNIFNEIDNYNNSIANEKLSAMREQFSNYLDYLCTHQENATDLFRQIFCKGMAKNENSTISAKDAIRIINSAIDVYYTHINPTAKESTQNQQKNYLKKFISYVERYEVVTIKELLSQKSINDFRTYMIDHNTTASTCNQCGSVITMLINKVIATHTDFLKYGVTPVQWVKFKDTRTSDDKNKHFPLNADEIQAIKDCKTLTAKESEFRTIFILQCLIGQRVGDLISFLVNKNYERKNGYYYIKTQKRGQEALIRDCDEVNNLIDQVNNFKHLNIAIKDFTKEYNIAIKKIAKKSGLNRIITGKDANGKEYAKPIHEVISSHCARYTFVRNMCINGVPKEQVILMTGHADTNMIDKVYLRYSKEDKANILNDAFAAIKQSKNKESKPESKPEKKKASIKDVVFAYSAVKSVGDRYDLPIVETIIKKIKAIPKNIDRCISVYNDATESEKEQFAADINSLDCFYYELARIKNDTDIYKQYQYKQKLFGLVDVILTDDVIISMWQQDETEYFSDEAAAKRFFDTGNINQ